MISDSNNVSALKFYEKVAEKSELASKDLTNEEIRARDKAWNVAPLSSHLDGWLWNVCWNTAREYYLKKNNSGDNLVASHVAPYEERETSKNILAKSNLFDRTDIYPTDEQEHWPEED